MITFKARMDPDSMDVCNDDAVFACITRYNSRPAFHMLVACYQVSLDELTLIRDTLAKFAGEKR